MLLHDAENGSRCKTSTVQVGPKNLTKLLMKTKIVRTTYGPAGLQKETDHCISRTLCIIFGDRHCWCCVGFVVTFGEIEKITAAVFCVFLLI